MSLNNEEKKDKTYLSPYLSPSLFPATLNTSEEGSFDDEKILPSTDTRAKKSKPTKPQKKTLTVDVKAHTIIRELLWQYKKREDNPKLTISDVIYLLYKDHHGYHDMVKLNAKLVSKVESLQLQVNQEFKQSFQDNFFGK